ncbi:hypothetical protein MTO96_007915 [Rhipicephalus appendiculatus]
MDEHEAAVEEVEQDCSVDDGPSLLDLPDGMLMKICQYSEPFDFAPCLRIPKQWFFRLLRLCRERRPPQMERVLLENGETWLRMRNDRFACKVTMLAWAYQAMNNKASPFILQRLWVDDIALYKRLCPRIDFSVSKLKLRSKQCHPAGHPGQGSAKRPSRPKAAQQGYALETSGVDGLLTCASYVLEQHLARACLRGQETVVKMATRIKEACWGLYSAYVDHKSMIEDRWPDCPVAHAIISMSEDGWPDFTSCQPSLDPVGLQWREVMSRCAALLKEHGTLDAIVDMARIRWRRVLLSDIEAVVGPSDETFVSRINLTDCDVIGGDNPRQDMAAAAFVSPSGVLVTWQLLGQGRY